MNIAVHDGAVPETTLADRITLALRYAERELGVTRKDVIDALRLSRNTLNNWAEGHSDPCNNRSPFYAEKGKERLELLADICHVSRTWLLTGRVVGPAPRRAVADRRRRRNKKAADLHDKGSWCTQAVKPEDRRNPFVAA